MESKKAFFVAHLSSFNVIGLMLIFTSLLSRCNHWSSLFLCTTQAEWYGTMWIHREKALPCVLDKVCEKKTSYEIALFEDIETSKKKWL